MRSNRKLKLFSVPALAVVLGVAAPACSMAQQYDVPFVPTPQSVVDRMLKMTNTQPDDIVYDLGSGDGRIVIAAIRNFNVKKGVGVDINPVRVKEGNDNAAKAGVTDRATFVQGNVFEFDFSEATVVTMYLLPSVNLRLRDRVLNELRPGTRVVSHQFDMGDWEADQHEEVENRDVYMWIVPAKVAGTWTWEAGGTNYSLVLKQEFQKVSGTLSAGGKQTPISNAKLSGTALEFESGGQKFTGTVTGEKTMEGKLGSAEVKATLGN